MTTLCLIGCGAMGGSIMQRLPADAPWQQVIIADAAPAQLPPPHFYTTTWSTAALCAAGYAKPVDVLLLAVKPQAFNALAPTLAPLCGAHTMVVSVMAGVTSATIADALPPVAQVIRTMPNLAGTCTVFGQSFSDTSKHLLAQVFGKNIYYSDEDLSHLITAVSGSGMAYFLYLTQCLAEAAYLSGMDADQATALARQTLHDAAYFSQQHPHDTVAQLRARITSKGGTTHAAVSVLEHHLPSLMQRAVDAAAQRSVFLSRNNILFAFL